MQLKNTMPALAALAVAFGAAAPALAATRDDVYPPPGMYQVDADATVKRNRGALPAVIAHLQQDGASGASRVSGGKLGRETRSVDHAGSEPTRVCMAPLAKGGAMPKASGCKSSAPIRTADSLSYVMLCRGMKTNTTIRKLDDRTWEYKVATVMSGSPMGGQPNYAATRTVLAAQAKNAPTAAERARAAELLSQMGIYEAEMKSKAAELAQGRAETDYAAGAGAAGGEHTSTVRLTRIADSCAAPSK